MSASISSLTGALQPPPITNQESNIYKRHPQPYHSFNGSIWVPYTSTTPAPVSPSTFPSISPTSIRLLSWNIDFMAPFGSIRMSAALTYLSNLVSASPSSTPLVILLQEMTPRDLALIRDTEWIQKWFFVTDINAESWHGSSYGTTTLVDRRLRIAEVFRVRWYSQMDRDGLFVDLLVTRDGTGEHGREVLRLCNTHLESLVANPPIRPGQMEIAGKYLHGEKVAAALLAGDLNAIQPFDRDLHTNNGLRDAYLDLGGKEDSDDGYTWGYQSRPGTRERFGCSRMDKILYRGHLKVQAFERIGVGERVAEEERAMIRLANREDWVTDHYGVRGDFELDGATFVEYDG